MNKTTVFKPDLSTKDYDAIKESLEIGWLGQGSYTQKFELAVQNHCHAQEKYPVGVSTGYAAIHLALVLANVQEGDEVITPSLNNVADFQAIEHTGASIVFCDIKPNTLCIDLDKAEQLITPNTKAIIIIDYACWKADYKKAEYLSKKYNIRIIHDAAHSFNWKHQNKMIGSFSDLLMFSFDPVKTITCIDGGILMTSSEEEAQRAQELRIMGMGQSTNINYQNKRAWSYDVKHKGYRYHLANAHAALGLSQLQRIEEIAEKRKNIFRYYTSKLKNIEEIRIPKTNLEEVTPLLYVIQAPPNMRNLIRTELEAKNIETGLHWKPGHLFSYFSDKKSGDLTITENVFASFLSLPLHPNVSLQEVDIIEKTIKNIFTKKIFMPRYSSKNHSL